MKALLDLSGIKSGGGAQLATNFLAHMADGGSEAMFDLILVSDKFPKPDRLRSFRELIIAPADNVGRLQFEHLKLPGIMKERGITHSYTFFGPGLPKMNGLKQLVGVAYPTLVYDDSPYWQYLPFGFKAKKRLQNALRKSRLRRADHLIFETETMLSRAQSADLVRAGASVIPPTPTAFLTPSAIPKDQLTRFIILAGTDPHKNLWRLFEALPAIEKAGLKVSFLLSIKRDVFLSAMPGVDSEMTRLADTYFEFLGPLPPDDLQAAYDRANVVLNIADLESFSNNYMEAWLVGRPILASDRDFARAICGGSAIYAEPHDITSLVESISAFVDGSLDTDGMVSEGRNRLSKLPSLNDRVALIRATLEGL